MKKGKKSISRLIAYSVTGLIAVLALVAAIAYFGAGRYVSKKLPEWVDRESGHLYRLSFDAATFKFYPVSFVFENIALEANLEEFRKFNAVNPDKTIYEFKAPKMEVVGISLYSLVKEKQLLCQSLNIWKPELKLAGEDIIQLDSTRTLDNVFIELQPIFKKWIKKIYIGEINFEDANYKIYATSSAGNPVSNAQQISLTIKKFTTDSAMIFSSSSFFESEDILIKMKKSRHSLGDSLHVITIDTLEYSLKTSDIYANGFRLFPENGNRQKNRYDVFVPRLHLKSKSITRLAFGDTLDVQSLRFENPKIKFYQKENPNKFDIDDINRFNLYSLVESDFSKMEVDTFSLKNAQIEIYRQNDTSNFQQRFASVNVSLFGFALDSTSSKNPSKIFHANDLTMAVAGYHLRLEDNQHEFLADSMFASTLSNTLGTKGISVAPLKTTAKRRRTEANIKCRELVIENVNLKTLFHTRTLPTRNIRITEPNVKIQYHTEIQKRRGQLEAGLLFELVSAYLKGVYSETVQVVKGRLNIENLQQKEVLGYFETNFNFLLSGFSLDEQSMKQTDKFFYATNFDLQFTDYQMKLVDNLHRINVEKVSIQSFDRRLSISNLLLEPVLDDADLAVMQNFNRSELYRVFVPNIDMRGINLRDAFFYNKLTMDQFEITSPEISLENFGLLRQKKDKSEFTELYQLLFNYMEDFNISEINVPEGKFNWINHTKKGKTTSFDNGFSARLENFRLNENELSKNRLFFSDQFQLALNDQVFQLSDSVHILQAGKIEVSSKNSNVSIKDAFLYPDDKARNYIRLATTFQASIPALEISKIDFQKAWFSKELVMGKLEINNSKFRIFSKEGVGKTLDLNKFQFPLPSLISSLQINELKVNNGQVTTYETSRSKQTQQSSFNVQLTLPDVRLKNNAKNQAQLTTQNVIARFSRFSTPLGNQHELKMDELNFDRQKKTVSIAQLQVVPHREKRKGNEFQVFAPQIRITGFDVNQALKNNHFVFDEILADNTKIGINITDSIKGDKLEFTKNLDLYPFIEPYMERLAIGQLRLNNVDLDFNWFRKILIDRFFDLTFKEINIAENQKSSNLLHAREFEVSTKNLSTKSKNGQYEFSAGSLVYNSEKHAALLRNIKINPLLTQSQFNRQNTFQTDYISGSTQQVELKGVNENKWIQQNVLEADALLIGETSLDIFRNKRLPFNENQRPPWPQDLIVEIDQPFIFDSVMLMPTTLKYSELNDITDTPGYLTFNGLQLKTGKFSNIVSVQKQNPKLKIDASSKIMNAALIKAEIEFDLTDRNYKHTIKGNMEPVEVSVFNPMIENSVPLRVETGKINRFDFEFTLDRNFSKGEVFLGYDDLKIAVLNLDKDEVKKAKLATFWANSMLINSKNPKGNEFLPELVNYERDERRSVINYWWKSVFTGSKQAIGIKPEK